MGTANDAITRTAPAVCPLDCADTCSLNITLRDGQIDAVRGSHDNPFTRGKLCAKVTNALGEQVHGRDRIRTPLLKGAGKHSFSPISWDDALEVVAERFQSIIREYGPQAIAPLCYGGPMGLLAGHSMDRRFFHRLGATKVDSSTLCAGTSGAAWEAIFGDAGGIDYEELTDARLILVWGNNVTTCNLHATTLIRDARKRGAKLVVVDPKRTRIAREADLHIPLLPGTDVVLAYAVANLLAQRDGLDQEFIAANVHGAERFLKAAEDYPTARAAELCDVDAAAIESLAQLLATLSPAAMSLGVAPERNRNGGAGVRGALSLLALTGNIGPRGAGPCDVSHYFPVRHDALERSDLAPEATRELNVLDIPRYVLDPGEELPLKALFIYNHNPVAVHPQQGRMREALLSESVFVVGSDVSMTDSMACADLVLPATSHLEYGDLYKAYGHRYLQRSEAVIPAVGDAHSNMDLFRELAARFGFDEPCFNDSDDDLMKQAFASNENHPAQLAKSGALDMTGFAEPALMRGATITTPSGRIELFSDALEARDGEGLPRFRPLDEVGEVREFLVVSPASEQRINSTFGGITSQQSDVRCEINPADARQHGIAQGDEVRLFNSYGEVCLPALLSDDVRRGTLFVPKGAWMDDALTGNTINALIPPHKDGLHGGACYYDCSVDIQKHE